MSSPYSELQQTLKANASTNSLPRPDISSERRSSLSGLEVPRKGLTLQRSQPTSEKRNKEFHNLFKSIPEEDHLIEDYGCALQKEILLQGRIYISQRYVCFNSNIFGWVTNLVIAFSDIVEIEKKTTAIFIPNAIQISTHQSKHFFASFLSREQAYEQMMEIWKSPLRSTMSMNSTTKDINDSFDDQSLLSDDSLSLSQWDEKDDRDFNGKKPYQHDLLSSSNEQWHDERQSSLASLPIPKQHSHEENEAARRRAISEAGPRPSTESLTLMQNASEVPLPNHSHINQISTHHSHPHDNSSNNTYDKTAINNQSDIKNESNGLPSISKQSQTSHQSKPTTDCQCVKNAEDHYPNVVMDQTYHCSMETLYNLLYQSDFVKKFLIDIEKNTDVVIGSWCKGDNVPFSREMSYTKYLGGSIGPKTTKCLLKEELTHLDFKNSITQQITCHTPDVPSGNSFCVKTRVCISWASQGCVRMLVTVQVPFSRSSWLKSTIEKASIFGQVNYYKRLDTAIRQYTESKSHGSSSSRTKKHRHKRKTQSRLSGNYGHSGKDTNNNNNSNNNQSSNKNGILGMLSSALSDIFQMISGLGTSSISIAQCTMICLVLMVMINLYIALKMAYMGDRLYTLHSHNDQSSSSSSSSPSSFFSTFYQSHGKKSSSSSPLDIWRDQHQDDVDSMWHWLNQLDHSQKQYNNNDNKMNKKDHHHHNKNSNYILTEHFKHQGKVSPEFLKQHIMELEKMVYRTENSIDQVHKAVRKQRQNLLQNLAS
ncbi:unnamed protein product [Cunninghamella echinulata]